MVRVAEQAADTPRRANARLSQERRAVEQAADTVRRADARSAVDVRTAERSASNRRRAQHRVDPTAVTNDRRAARNANFFKRYRGIVASASDVVVLCSCSEAVGQYERFPSEPMTCAAATRHVPWPRADHPYVLILRRLSTSARLLNAELATGRLCFRPGGGIDTPFDEGRSWLRICGLTYAMRQRDWTHPQDFTVYWDREQSTGLPPEHRALLPELVGLLRATGARMRPEVANAMVLPGNVVTAEVPDAQLTLHPVGRALAEARVNADTMAAAFVGPAALPSVPSVSVAGRFINSIDATYDSHLYPLLFTHGQDGWSPARRMTLLKWSRSILLHEAQLLFAASRLGQQWVLDTAMRILSMKVCIWRTEKVQAVLRRMDALAPHRTRFVPEHSTAAAPPTDVTRLRREDNLEARAAPAHLRRIFLPHSAPGSPFRQARLLCDALEIVLREGMPHLFFTVTANPTWPEVRAFCERTGTVAGDRPDIVTRAFHERLLMLRALVSGSSLLSLFHYRPHDRLLDSEENDPFGRNWHDGRVYVIEVIEFQMRGLPHAHFVLRLRFSSAEMQDAFDNDRELQKRFFSRLIMADIPTEEEADIPVYPGIPSRLPWAPLTWRQFRDAQLRTQVHHCRSSCRQGVSENQPCNAGYPKRRTAVPGFDEHGYPIYPRRSPGSENIVAVIPLILQVWGGHCNVDWTAGAGCIAYLMKYLTKGAETVRVRIQTAEDQILEYANTTYFPVARAVWQLMNYNINYRDPSVMLIRLFPDPNEDPAPAASACEADGSAPRIAQAIEEEDNEVEGSDDSDASQPNAALPTSELDTYFRRPEREPFESLTIRDYYEKYTIQNSRRPARRGYAVDMDGNYVTLRTQRRRIARFAAIRPNSDLFNLKLLLEHFPGRTRRDLRGGSATYRDAAIARGLLSREDGAEYTHALQEACRVLPTGALCNSPSEIRHLLYICCQQAHPQANQFIMDFGHFATFDWAVSAEGSPQDPARIIPPLSAPMLRRLLAFLDETARLNGLPGLYGLGIRVTQLAEELHWQYIDVNPGQHTALQRERASMRDMMVQNIPLPPLSILNADQLAVFDLVMTQVRLPGLQRRPIHLNAKAGTGKTFLLNLLAGHLRRDDRIVRCCASSGVAALLLPGGTTAHSAFGLPITQSIDVGATIS